MLVDYINSPLYKIIFFLILVWNSKCLHRYCITPLFVFNIICSYLFSYLNGCTA